MATLKLENVNKIYSNNIQAVFDFNLEIDDKDFIVLVGPSGCGKSTTLRMIAGLEEITTGSFFIDNEIMNNIPPKDRDIAMVFQSYALYPHMTVYKNMEFGLKLRKIPKAERERKVLASAEMLGLTKYLDRKPKALSGGQRQRVALGRAIVRNAKVFLMDEPLSNLDAKLRVQMRAEIIKLHEKIGTTTVYVTHDQIEAMTMATKIVVMKDGYIQQVGAPKEIYDYPNNVFVGAFMGTPPMNFIKGNVSADMRFNVGNFSLPITNEHFEMLSENDFINKEILMGVRPEFIFDNNNGIMFEHERCTKISVEVEIAELLGSETLINSVFEGQQLISKVSARDDIKIGMNIELSIDMSTVHFFDPISTLRIRDKERFNTLRKIELEKSTT